MTLFALITTLMFNGIRVAARSFDAAEAHIDRSEQTRLSEAFLRRELTQTTPMIFPAADRHPAALAFRGEPDSLVFASILPAHRGVGGVFLLNLEVRGEAPEMSLVASYRLFNPSQRELPTADKDEKQSVALLEHLSKAAWSYYGQSAPAARNAPTAQGAFTWDERWRNAQLLPRLVRLRAAGTELPGPVDWVFPIHVQVDPRLSQGLEVSEEGTPEQADEPDSPGEPVNADEADPNDPEDAGQ